MMVNAYSIEPYRSNTVGKYFRLFFSGNLGVVDKIDTIEPCRDILALGKNKMTIS